MIRKQVDQKFLKIFSFIDVEKEIGAWARRGFECVGAPIMLENEKAWYQLMVKYEYYPDKISDSINRQMRSIGGLWNT